MKKIILFAAFFLAATISWAGPGDPYYTYQANSIQTGGVFSVSSGSVTGQFSTQTIKFSTNTATPWNGTSGLRLQAVNQFFTYASSATTSVGMSASNITLSITPVLSTDWIHIHVHGSITNGTVADTCNLTIYQGAINLFNTVAEQFEQSPTAANVVAPFSIDVSTQTGSTSAATFTLYFAAPAGTCTIQPSSTGGYMSLEDIGN